MRSVPPDRRPSQWPWQEEGISRFDGVEQAVAIGIRHAERQVVLVNRSSEPVSAALNDFARSRGIEICRVSIDEFEPERLERLSWLHFVPAPGTTYHRPYAWCERFVPEV